MASLVVFLVFYVRPRCSSSDDSARYEMLKNMEEEDFHDFSEDPAMVQMVRDVISESPGLNPHVVTLPSCRTLSNPESLQDIKLVDVTERLRDKVQEMFDFFFGEPPSSSFVDAGISSAAQNYQVVTVKRVENIAMWRKYHATRSSIAIRSFHQPHPVGLSAFDWLEKDFELETAVNEVFLFHGTSPGIAKIVIQQGFDNRVANLKGKYGAGCTLRTTCARATSMRTRASRGRATSSSRAWFSARPASLQLTTAPSTAAPGRNDGISDGLCDWEFGGVQGIRGVR